MDTLKLKDALISKNRSKSTPNSAKTVPTAPIKCLGPVSNPEKHLHPEWWRVLFNSLYLKTDADVTENHENTTQEVDLITSLADLQPTDPILDLCCGQGRHVLELAKRGFKSVMGIDRSRYLVKLARKRASTTSLKHAKFSEGDARKIRYSASAFKCVIVMGNSFGYFEQENDDLCVLKEVYRVLASEGTAIFDITDGEWMKTQFEPRSWEWVDQNLLVCRERTLSSEGNRLISREVIIDSEKGAIADQFYAERLYTFETLKALLEEAGFHKISLETKLKSLSTRDQDMGMMSNRLIVKASVPQKKPVIRSTAKQVMNCAVLLGDPTLPDKVKMNNQFNPEDLDTVEKLKNALSTLPDFKFTFLNNHASMASQLLKLKPSIVFNLCDEGYNNEAIKELHIPAYLEMLNIPYTGSGPACLAVCYDKGLVRLVAQELDIPVPEEVWIDPRTRSVALPNVFPALMKPSLGDSSLGITKNSVVHNAEELVSYFDWLKTECPNIPILVQEFLSGREFSVAVIGNGCNLEAIGVLEVDYSDLPTDLPQILGYESKWDPNSEYWTKIKYHPANLSEDEYSKIVDASLQLFDRLGCRDYARFDFRTDAKGVIKLLEVNPNPGWCWDGKFNLIAGYGGITYIQMLEKIINCALNRVGLDNFS